MGILSKFSFSKNISEIFKDFYQHADLDNVQWVCLTVNTSLTKETFLSRELEIHTKKDAHLLRLALGLDEMLCELWQNQQKLAKVKRQKNEESSLEFNSLIDRLIEKNIFHLQNQLQILDDKTFSASEVAIEDKALEWMRVSFMMLEKAIVHSLTDPTLLFQTKLFMGTHPKTRLSEIRLITFNLDIKYEILPNHLLRVRIFNDKNEEFGTAKKASLEGDFNYRKREMLDELTKLLSAVSSGIKI